MQSTCWECFTSKLAEQQLFPLTVCVCFCVCRPEIVQILSILLDCIVYLNKLNSHVQIYVPKLTLTSLKKKKKKKKHFLFCCSYFLHISVLSCVSFNCYYKTYNCFSHKVTDKMTFYWLKISFKRYVHKR